VDKNFSEQHTMKYAFNLCCRLNADKELIVEPAARYTGAVLNQEARSFARALDSFRVEKGEVVALLGTSSCRFYAAYFAAHKLGAVTCNLHYRESAHYIGEVLRQIEAKVLVCSESMLELAMGAVKTLPHAVPVISLGDTAPAGIAGAYGECIDRFPAEEPVVDVSPEDPAVIILSSGSTGAPKGIVHSNWNYVRWIHATPTLFGPISRSTRYLIIVGTSFAAWAFSSITVVMAGGTIVIEQAFVPERFCRLIEEERISAFGTVPTVIRVLEPAITDGYDFSSVKMVLCAGESPSEQDIQRIRSWGDCDIRCLYLASETANATACYWELADLVDHGKPVCAGKPVPGTDIRIINPNGGIDDELPCGEKGEIAFRGPTIALGYLKNEALTAERFVNGWWRSGDMGHFDQDGYLFVSGRTDNMINSGGIKVYGEEIENCLLSHPEVAMAAVIGVANPQWGQRIEAHLVCMQDVAEDELDQHCRERLASFKCPKRYVFHAELPLGVTGKLDRVALRKMASG
jgi:acyl-coenzyme A synthetase/AMP-(fatty) acid ligase|tara:strand:- start:1032 stop:2585 length:1554 start_codon:yes stop_codon:yes gene_type:complete